MLTALLAALSFVSVPQETRPPVFVELTFDELLAKGKAEKRVAILDAMTSWCGPCKQMDATTWRDAGVVKWFADNGLAIQLDMDQHTALKERLKISAYPTIVAFRDGAEFDRIVGSRNAAEFSEWLESVRAGKTSRERLGAKLDAARAQGAAGYATRRALVEELAFGNELAEAQVEYLWLWDNAAASGRPVAEEHAAMAFDLRQLSEGHSPARAELTKRRDALEASATSTAATRDQQSDWLTLNFALSDAQRTARWAARLAATPAGAATLQAFEPRLFDLLVEQGEWKAAGVCLADPLKSVKWLADNLGAYDVSADGKRVSMPAIPMTAGGMKPAVPAAAPKTEPEQPAEPKQGESIPAIPLLGKPAGGSAPMPAIPMMQGGGARPAVPQDPAEIAREVRSRLTAQLRDMASKRYAALLACGRGSEAEQVATALLGAADDSRARAALVAQALRAGVLEAQRERHQAWLDQAAQ